MFQHQIPNGLKLQGSGAQSTKNLQSQNSLQEELRLQLSRLAVLHGRLDMVAREPSENWRPVPGAPPGLGRVGRG